MKQSIFRLSLMALVAAAIASSQAQSPDQTANKVAAEKNAAPETGATTNAQKSAKGGPFRGKLAAVDQVAKTIVVGKRTFQITSETKIKKSGKPALLEDGVVGEPVSGYVKPATDGKLVATTVNFGPKAGAGVAEKPEKQKAAPEKEPPAK